MDINTSDSFRALEGPPEDPQTIQAITEYLNSSLASRNLTSLEKIQVLRDLMASNFAINSTFYHCCQNIITRISREPPDVLATIPDVHVVLTDPKVLLLLLKSPLQDVVGGNIAFRVACIEELGQMHQTDILLEQIGYLSHWAEGQAMLRTLLHSADIDQLFHVLLMFVYNQFSKKGRYNFGQAVYREELVDMFFSAVVSRATVSQLSQLSIEFGKGATVVGLPAEQFERYASFIKVKFAVSRIKSELPAVVPEPPSAHAESGVFWVSDITSQHGDGSPGYEAVSPVAPPLPITPPSIPAGVAYPVDPLNPPTVYNSPIPDFAPAPAPLPPSPQQAATVDDEKLDEPI